MLALNTAAVAHRRAPLRLLRQGFSNALLRNDGGDLLLLCQSRSLIFAIEFVAYGKVRLRSIARGPKAC